MTSKLLNKLSYFQGGGGENEPTPNKKKYKIDPLQDHLRNHVDRQVKEPLQVFYKNYDLYDTGDPSPGKGFYSDMEKYKSISDFRTKKRKKKMKERQATFLHFLVKVAEDQNNLTDPTEGQVTPIPFSPAEPNSLGLLDGIYPKEDLEGKPVTNLYYGRVDVNTVDEEDFEEDAENS